MVRFQSLLREPCSGTSAHPMSFFFALPQLLLLIRRQISECSFQKGSSLRFPESALLPSFFSFLFLSPNLGDKNQAPVRLTDEEEREQKAGFEKRVLGFVNVPSKSRYMISAVIWNIHATSQKCSDDRETGGLLSS